MEMVIVIHLLQSIRD